MPVTSHSPGNTHCPHAGAPSHEPRLQLAAAVLSALWVIGVPMFYSSTAYRRTGLLLAGAAAAIALWPTLRASCGIQNRIFRWILGGLAMAHLASWIGGLLQGASVTELTLQAVKGCAGVASIWFLICFWLRDPWKAVAGKILLTTLTVLVGSSLLGFFFAIETIPEAKALPPHFGPLRIALIWPLRGFTLDQGQMLWEHTNIAGYFFGLGFIILTHLLLKLRQHPFLWILAGLCLVAVFLTGSRSAWLMVIAGGTLLIFRQPIEQLLKIAALVVISLTLGFFGLNQKASSIETIDQQTPRQQIERSGHLAGIVKRGSSGRLHGYEQLWRELENHRTFGCGLPATGKPVAQLTHEHSIFLASLRGGGLVALFAHLTLVAAAAWQALCLYRNGVRWPLAILVTVITGLLFDRSTIFKLTGHHDFIFHWSAILIPFFVPKICNPQSATLNPPSATPPASPQSAA